MGTTLWTIGPGPWWLPVVSRCLAIRQLTWRPPADAEEAVVPAAESTGPECKVSVERCKKYAGQLDGVMPCLCV